MSETGAVGRYLVGNVSEDNIVPKPSRLSRVDRIKHESNLKEKCKLMAHCNILQIFSSKDEEKDGEEEEEGSRGKKKNKKSRTDEAKDLLAKYGGAYLATSITLSLISFSLCYALISAGVDVQALLQKVGITTTETGEKLGTFALAYAAHKAASPIRFPPTVALTPIVASWIGKKVEKNEKSNP